MATELILIKILVWLGFILLASMFTWILSSIDDDDKLLNKISGYIWALSALGIIICSAIKYSL